MTSDPPIPSRGPRKGDMSFRQLNSGSIRHVMLADGEQLKAGADPEIVVQIAGRGRVLWPGAEKDERPCSTVFMPLGTPLNAKGSLRALRVVLNALGKSLQAGPVSEVLVGLLCSRAWHSSEPVAEAAMTLIHRLIEEEAEKAQRPKLNGRG